VYSKIDSVGWIPHSDESIITAQPTWFVGETKACSSIPLDDQTAKALSKSVGHAISAINCDDGPSHRMTIKFFGKTEQPENALATWNCTRTADSFVCRQTGAVLIQKSEPYQQVQPGAGLNLSPAANRSSELCNNSQHVMTVSEVREYARKKGISPNDAATEVSEAGCGIVADP
jgi:hypothetical protein